MANKAKKTLIVGLGVSGLSVARYLARNQQTFEVADQKTTLPESLRVQEPMLNEITFHGGGWTAELLKSFDRVVVSPGVPTRTDAFNEAREAGVEVIGDVELFVSETKKPVLAVTGSNGKSTVVNMVGEILQAADLRASVVGNVGVACLDRLADEATDIYVLELSSFQLETTPSLSALVACVLNVSEDHLDRYDGLADYAAVKRTIYNRAQQIVFNLDDELTHPEADQLLAAKSLQNFSITGDQSAWFVKREQAAMLCGPSGCIPTSTLKVDGGHNQGNALAAMAIASPFLKQLEKDQASAFEKGLARFTGLPHRTERICESGGVTWFNDSKGTNVGACISAIQGMQGPVVLIAGGRGKNAEYETMKQIISDRCRCVVLIGEDAEKIHSAIGDVVPVFHEASMKAAVQRAAKSASAGDCVLLSPACASFDMFKNFECRGNAFTDEVRKLCA